MRQVPPHSNSARTAEGATPLARRLRWVAAVVAIACAATACAPELDAELLEVRRVGPDRLEPGRRMRVRGAGFPPGRTGRMRIEGRMHRPDAAPRSVSVELAARALSAEQVEARFTAEALEALGGRGTVHGRVAVIFDAVGAGLVSGHSPPVVLDIVPPSTDRLSEELARRRHATRLVDWLGLGLGEEPPDERGLVVERVDEGSAAARAGLLAGDWLIALEGVRLHALSDFLPPPSATRASVDVGRESEAGSFSVTLPVGTAERALTKTEVLAAQVAFLWVLLVLFVLAPSASGLDWLMWREGRPMEGDPGRRSHRGRARLARLAIGTTFFPILGIAAQAGLVQVPLQVLLLGALAARTTAAALGTPGTRAARARAVLAAAGGVALAAIGLAAVGAMAGTNDLSALADSQGPMPWQWTGFRTAAGPACVVLLVRAGAFRARGKGTSGGLAVAIDETVALLLAVAVTMALLGGWNTGGDSISMHALGVALFTVKAGTVWALMRRLGARGERGAWITVTIASLFAVTLSALWILAHPPLELEHALGEVSTAALALVGASLLYRSIRGDGADELAPAHPFA